MNYFTDNEDLQFILDSSDLAGIIEMQERGFREKETYDYAPADIEDALDSYRKILTIAGDIAANTIAPLGERIDREPNSLAKGKVTYSQPIKDCLRALSQAELMGCVISRHYGGLNLPNFIFTMLVEIISRGDASIQNIFGLQGIAAIIEEFGDAGTKARYLPLLASGAATGAMALTEAEAGSDLQNIKTKAEQAADGTWRISGVKRFITNGNADIILVLARSEPGTTDGLGLSLFLCEGDDTVVVRRLEDKLGIHGSPTCELQFTGTRAILIGERQRGLVTYVLALLNGARVATAAQAVGIAQAAFTAARSFAHSRKQYGRRIETLPPVAEMLTSMKIAIESSRALTCETARILDLSQLTAQRLAAEDLDNNTKKELRKEAKQLERLTMLLSSLAKYYTSEMSVWVTRDALQVLGGSGYMRDYPVERYYRDARITTIYEGTSQLQVQSAFRGILSGTLEKYFADLSVQGFPRPQASLVKKLERWRKILARSVEQLNSKKDAQLLELYARPVVDMGVEILMGYLLLRQAQASSRKLKITKMYLNERAPLIGMRAEIIRHGSKHCIKDYELIVGAAVI
ncbi:MAG: acyl-CoA dehydrogenase family protein [Proteobacteria bacterium]|nr:acyl-CoA dehydrogenase family protein [Pseudomonadota bacterium]